MNTEWSLHCATVPMRGGAYNAQATGATGGGIPVLDVTVSTTTSPAMDVILTCRHGTAMRMAGTSRLFGSWCRTVQHSAWEGRQQRAGAAVRMKVWRDKHHNAINLSGSSRSEQQCAASGSCKQQAGQSQAASCRLSRGSRQQSTQMQAPGRLPKTVQPMNSRGAHLEGEHPLAAVIRVVVSVLVVSRAVNCEPVAEHVELHQLDGHAAKAGGTGKCMGMCRSR